MPSRRCSQLSKTTSICRSVSAAATVSVRSWPICGRAPMAAAIWRVDGAASEMQDGELVASLKFPASLAFGRGPGFDPCSLYVTQLAADGVIRVAVGSPGAPRYD